MAAGTASAHSRVKRGTGRAAILDAALRLVAGRGVHGWTMRDVAVEARCSLGSTTYHFADRHQLIQEALQVFAADEIGRFEAAMSSMDAAASDAAATVSSVLREIDASLARPWAVVAQMELYLAATRDPAMAALAGKVLDAYHRFVERAVILLGCPAAKSSARASLIVAVVDGMVLHHLARGETTEIAADLAQAVVAVATSPA